MKPCPEKARSLVALGLALLEPADATATAEHAKTCPGCAAFGAEAASVASELRLPEDEPRHQWERLAAGVEALSRPGPRVALRCAYCHDGLASERAAYCAACLAPHHTDCFKEHGTCSAPGCGEERFVVPQTAAPRPRRRWVRAAATGLVAAALSGGVAALTRRPAAVVRARMATPGYVAIDARGEKLSQVVAQLSTLARRPIGIAPRADVVVHVSLDHAHWRDALDVVAGAAECEVKETGDDLYLDREPFLSVQCTDKDVRLVIQELAAAAERNVIIDPRVRGEVTLEMKPKTHWLKLLQAVVKTCGDYVLVEERPDLIRVVPRSRIDDQKISKAVPLRRLRGVAVDALKSALERARAENTDLRDATFVHDERTGAFLVNGNVVAVKELEKLIRRHDLAADPPEGPR